MLRPTPGDPWGVEQHHWNTGAEENQQLKPANSKIFFNNIFYLNDFLLISIVTDRELASPIRLSISVKNPYKCTTTLTADVYRKR